MPPEHINEVPSPFLEAAEFEAPTEEPSLMAVFADTDVEILGHTGKLVDLVELCPIPPEKRSAAAMDKFAAKVLTAAGIEIPENFKSILQPDNPTEAKNNSKSLSVDTPQKPPSSAIKPLHERQNASATVNSHIPHMAKDRIVRPLVANRVAAVDAESETRPASAPLRSLDIAQIVHIAEAKPKLDLIVAGQGVDNVSDVPAAITPSQAIMRESEPLKALTNYSGNAAVLPKGNVEATSSSSLSKKVASLHQNLSAKETLDEQPAVKSVLEHSTVQDDMLIGMGAAAEYISPAYETSLLEDTMVSLEISDEAELYNQNDAQVAEGEQRVYPEVMHKPAEALASMLIEATAEQPHVPQVVSAESLSSVLSVDLQTGLIEYVRLASQPEMVTELSTQLIAIVQLTDRLRDLTAHDQIETTEAFGLQVELQALYEAVYNTAGLQSGDFGQIIAAICRREPPATHSAKSTGPVVDVMRERIQTIAQLTQRFVRPSAAVNQRATIGRLMVQSIGA